MRLLPRAGLFRERQRKTTAPNAARVFSERCAGWQAGKKCPSFPLALCELPHRGVLGAEAEVAPVVAR